VPCLGTSLIGCSIGHRSNWEVVLAAHRGQVLPADATSEAYCVSLFLITSRALGGDQASL
jgi:hypothetical protein